MEGEQSAQGFCLFASSVKAYSHWLRFCVSSRQTVGRLVRLFTDLDRGEDAALFPLSHPEACWGIFLFPLSLHHVVLPYLNSLSLSLTLFISPMRLLLPLSLIYFQIHHAFVSCKGLCPYPFFSCNIYIRSGLCPYYSPESFEFHRTCNPVHAHRMRSDRPLEPGRFRWGSHLRPGHELHLRIQPTRRQPGVKGRGWFHRHCPRHRTEAGDGGYSVRDRRSYAYACRVDERMRERAWRFDLWTGYMLTAHTLFAVSWPWIVRPLQRRCLHERRLAPTVTPLYRPSHFHSL